MSIKHTTLLLILLSCLLLSACQSATTEPFIAPTSAAVISPALPQAAPPTETPAADSPVQPEAQPTAQPAAPGDNPTIIEPTPIDIFLPITTSQTVDLWAAPYLPLALRSGGNFAPGVRLVDEPAHSGAEHVLSLDVGNDQIISRWVYALVTPFTGTAQPGAHFITFNDLLLHWQGQGSGPFAGQPLLMTQETLDVFIHVWGGPRPESVRVIPADRLLDEAWSAQAGLSGQPVLALVPFEAVEPRWSVLAVDAQSPMYNNFDVNAYPLTVPISLYGNADLVARIVAEYTPEAVTAFVPRTNRDAGRLTVVALTGVTALVRSTAFTMERQGNLYPARDIGAILQAADITHISNEVPFAVNCPEPDPNYSSLRFCSQDNYIELLEHVGADVIELTGDHFHDWGAEAMLHTVDMYNERGWEYYGGGVNLADGQRPAILEHNGNRIAFLGCNGKGAFFARATETNPGSAPCDMPKMAAEVARVRAEGYLPIFTFQHYEYYDYQIYPEQRSDFRMVADAGAVVVSGSQAHQPQGLEFYAGGFIHYGLGNLFFDQYLVSEACRQGFIDRHVFYDGRYLGVEMIAIYFEDFARARLMNDAETRSLLTILFKASGLTR